MESEIGKEKERERKIEIATCEKERGDALRPSARA